MKFLHSGDWHLGNGVRALSRRDECEEALNELLEIARREAVDCLLVAGDVFDTTTPSPEAEALLFDFLRELYGAGIPAVIIGGNHDHPKRLGAAPPAPGGAAGPAAPAVTAPRRPQSPSCPGSTSAMSFAGSPCWAASPTRSTPTRWPRWPLTSPAPSRATL